MATFGWYRGPMAFHRTLLFALVLTLPGAAQAAGSKGSGTEDSYLRVAPIAASVALPGGRRGVLTAEVGLDTADPTLRTLAQHSLPRLRAGWFRVTSAYAASLRPAAPPDADHLARELQKETDRVLGKAGAKVLLGSIMTN
jgi:hypothetical protein